MIKYIKISSIYEYNICSGGDYYKCPLCLKGLYYNPVDNSKSTAYSIFIFRDGRQEFNIYGYDGANFEGIMEEDYDICKNCLFLSADGCEIRDDVRWPKIIVSFFDKKNKIKVYGSPLIESEEIANILLSDRFELKYSCICPNCSNLNIKLLKIDFLSRPIKITDILTYFI